MSPILKIINRKPSNYLNIGINSDFRATIIIMLNKTKTMLIMNKKLRNFSRKKQMIEKNEK